MKKRIYINMVVLTCISVTLLTFLLIAAFYVKLEWQVKEELRNEGSFLSKMLPLLPEDAMDGNTLGLPAKEVRITLIEEDGSIRYDNFANPAQMENHLQREEVQQAFTTGSGESSRISATFGEKTYYYAKKLTDGNVLRVSKTASSIFGILRDMLPICIGMVAFTLLIGHCLAKRLTKKITQPLNEMDFNNAQCVYEELSPFLHTIAAQRKQLQEQFEELERKALTITTVMQDMQEGIVLLNLQGDILSLNPSAVQFLGDHAATGKNLIEVSRDADFMKFVKQALEGTRGHAVESRFGKTYSIFFTPVSGSGAVIFFLDITAQTSGEKMRREFSANVSHELKTPLTSIAGFAEMIEEGLIQPQDTAAAAGKIKDESFRLLSLIEDIIKLSELDEKEIILSLETVSLPQLIQDVTESLSRKAEQYHVSISLQLEDLTFAADRRLLFELIYNLVDNAIKYNKTNGTVSITLKKHQQRLCIFVADSGIGIPADSIPRIFERFYRVDKSHSKKTGGTGLGLSIAKHIAAYHGGQLTVESKEGTGTTMTLWLPEKALGAVPAPLSE